MQETADVKNYIMAIESGAFEDLDGEIAIEKLSDSRYELMNLSSLSAKEAVSLLEKGLEKTKEEHQNNQAVINEIEVAISSFK